MVQRKNFRTISRGVAKIGDATCEGGKGRTVRSLTFHSLRNSLNSAMASAGISQEVRMKLTGHMSADMNIRRAASLRLRVSRTRIQSHPNSLALGFRP